MAQIPQKTMNNQGLNLLREKQLGAVTFYPTFMVGFPAFLGVVNFVGGDPAYFYTHEMEHSADSLLEAMTTLKYTGLGTLATCLTYKAARRLFGIFTRKKDNRFQEDYDNLAQLVLGEQDNFVNTETYRSLPATHQEALLLDYMVYQLEQGSCSGVRLARSKIRHWKSDIVDKLVKEYIEPLPDEKLEPYQEILGKKDIGRLTNYYIQEDRLNDAETFARKQFFDNRSKQKSWLNKVASAYFDQGRLDEAERLWLETRNTKHLKKLLIPTYQNTGNFAKARQLFQSKI